MTEYKSKEAETKDIVDTLLGLPVRNLESRIKHLECDIQERQKIKNAALSTFGTHKLRLQEQIIQLRYVGMMGDAFVVKRDFQKQVTNLEEDAINEITGCFRDVLELKDKLQKAKEELELENLKLELIESDNKNVKK